MEKVLLLDDGISYFTNPLHIQKIYGKFWDEGIPICLAVTPALQGNKEDARPFNVTGNQKLCNYLSVMAEQRLVEICIRGYHGIPDEFDSEDDILLQQQIEDGKSILQSAFPSADINTFVLPEKSCSDTAIQLLTEYDYNLCTYAPPDKAFSKTPMENSRTRFSYSDAVLSSSGDDADNRIEKVLAQIEAQDFVVMRQQYHAFYDERDELNITLFDKWIQLVDKMLAFKNLEIDTFSFI